MSQTAHNFNYNTIPEISETLGLSLGLDHFPGLDLGLENAHFPGLGLGLSLEYS